VTGPSAASKSAGVVVGDRTAIRDGVRLHDFEQVKRQILDRISIQDVVAEHVTLKRRGVRWVGLCPFHSEKTPSFTVSPERGLFKCFGCGKGGDVFSFVQLRENVSFMEAMRHLADRAGVEFRDTTQRSPTAPGEPSRPDLALWVGPCGRGWPIAAKCRRKRRVWRRDARGR